MKIVLRDIAVKDLFKGYVNNEEDGVLGFDGKLNIRPKYQREFIYEKDKRDEVVRSVRKNFPLNVMYWSTNEDGTFELLDGQQRTLSICKFLKGDFSVEFENEKNTPFYFNNLTEEEQKQILDYKLTIYVCTGTEKEKLDWFKIINISGVTLTDQELRNAVYSGSWVTDAKRYFSKIGCAAAGKSDKYLKKKTNRQELLETVIKWISDNKIEQYMADHQHDENAKLLWNYFEDVIDWAKKLFPKPDKEIVENQEWGFLFNKYKTIKYNAAEFQKEIDRLKTDEDIQNYKGIVPYLFDREEWHLHLRSFTKYQKIRAFEKCEGKCSRCGILCSTWEEMEADHITPWSQGGKTEDDNLQMLCQPCNRKKSNK